jgi:hypothetical protein
MGPRIAGRGQACLALLHLFLRCVMLDQTTRWSAKKTPPHPASCLCAIHSRGTRHIRLQHRVSSRRRSYSLSLKHYKAIFHDRDTSAEVEDWNAVICCQGAQRRGEVGPCHLPLPGRRQNMSEPTHLRRSKVLRPSWMEIHDR